MSYTEACGLRFGKHGFRGSQLSVQRRRIRGDLATSKDTEVKLKDSHPYTHNPHRTTHYRRYPLGMHPPSLYHSTTSLILYFCRTGLTYKDTFDDLSICMRSLHSSPEISPY